MCTEKFLSRESFGSCLALKSRMWTKQYGKVVACGANASILVRYVPGNQVLEYQKCYGAFLNLKPKTN